MHELTVIKTIAYGLVCALFLGLLTRRIGLLPLVGYRVAGMAIGTHFHLKDLT
jgi:monovalent cation:H+ antiporter-2, CPA2 family